MKNRIERKRGWQLEIERESKGERHRPNDRGKERKIGRERGRDKEKKS